MSELTTRAEREQRRNDELSGKMHPASWPDEFVVRLCDHVDALEADNAKLSDVIAALRRRLAEREALLKQANAERTDWKRWTEERGEKDE